MTQINVELYIENQKVDLNENMPILLNKSIDDILNPSKINNTYSKTISIPSTSNNNILFGHIWNHNKIVYNTTGQTNINLYFNPSKKASFRLLYNSALFQSGYVKLSNIKFPNNYNHNIWEYEINLFGELGNFLQSFGDDLLVDKLSYSGSPYNQLFKINAQSCYNLYNAEVFSGTSRFSVNSLDELYTGSTTLNPYLINTGGTFNDRYFDILDSENGLYNISNKIEFDDGYNTDNTKKQTPLATDYTETDIRLKLSYKQRFGVFLDNLLLDIPELYGYTIDWGDTKNIDNPYWYRLMTTSPLLKTNNQIGNTQTTIISASTTVSVAVGSSGEFANPSNIGFYNQTNDIGIIDNNTNFNIPSELTSYKFSSKLDTISNTVTYLTGLPVEDNLNVFKSYDDNCKIRIEICYYKDFSNKYNNVTLYLVSDAVAEATQDYHYCKWRARQEAGDDYATIKVTTYDSSSLDWNIDDYIENFIDLPSENYLLDENVEFKILYGITKYYNTSNNYFLNAGTDNFYYNQIGIIISFKTYYELISSNELISGSYIPITKLLPAIKTKDLFINYLKIFGLYCEIDDVNNKKIYIKNRNEFYADYKIVDWTDKLCKNLEINIEPLNFDSKQIRFGWAKKKDSYLNKLYNEKYNEFYGDKLLETGYEFNNNVFDYNTENIFEPLTTWDNVPKYGINTYFKGAPEGSLTQPRNILVAAKESNGKLGEYDPISLVLNNGLMYTKDWRYHYLLTDLSEQMINNKEYIHNFNTGRINPYLDYDLQSTSPYDYYILNNPNIVYIPEGMRGKLKQACDYYPNPSAITHTLNFGKPRETYYTVTDEQYPESATIYNRYFKNWIEDRYNVNTKIMTAYFKLSAIDVLNFKFKDFIIVDGSLWTVNKIIDYNLMDDLPTKIELVKVNDINNYINGQNPY